MDVDSTLRRRTQSLRKLLVRQKARFLGTFAKWRRATAGFVMSVRLFALSSLAPTGRIFMIFDVLIFFQTLSRKIKFDLNLTWITGTLHGDLRTYVILTCWIFLRMRSVWGKGCRENQNTCVKFSNVFPENCAVYKIIWKNIVEPKKPQVTVIWCMRFACWITKATNTLVILIAVPRE